MRICFLIRAMDRGGAERQLSCLARELSVRGYQVHVLTFYAGGFLEKELRDAGVTVECLGKTGRWHILSTLGRLITATRRINPAILHGYLPTANLLALLAKPFIGKTKVVIGIRASDMNLSYYDMITAWSYRVERFFSRFADAAIANSHAGAAVYRDYVRPGSVHVIPNGIDGQVFRPLPDSSSRAAALREDIGMARTALLIGLVARVDPMKDHDTFLRAARAVNSRRADIGFICIAANLDSPAGVAVQQKTRDLGLASCVHWRSGFDDMQHVYPALDVLVLSSAWGEGFPNVIAEAMACGVPCVVTDVGDAAMVVGAAGAVVPAGDADALARALIRMADEAGAHKRRLSRAVRERIIKNFDMESFIQKSAMIIDQVAVN